MVITVLKQTFQKSSPKKLVYRDYKNFDRLTFKRELEEKRNLQINVFTDVSRYQQISISSKYF